MIKTFKSILQKYYDRNEKYISSDKVLYEMNGAVLYKTNNAIFDFHTIAVSDIKEYCKEQGYEIDKVVFISSYDVDIINNNIPGLNIKMEADSKIKIIKENNKIIAVVCIGEFVFIEEKKDG